jgi:staphylococcal nuclease domain-containing protein 1
MSQGTATVKAILSGDTVLLQGAQTDPNKAPPELKISLSSTQAPKLALKTAAVTTQDEPWAFECREALRELCIGKAVDFKVEYTINDRQFGTLMIGGKNVAQHLISQGLAEAVTGKNTSASLEDLQEAQKEAEGKHLGKWGGNGGRGVPRTIVYHNDEDFNGKAFYEQHKKEKMPCIVEWVRDAGHVRVLLLPSDGLKTYALVGVSFTGLQVDGFKRDRETNVEQPDGPTSRKAKNFLEFRVLNRKLEVRLEHVDQFGNLFGTLYHPRGVISKFLVQEGLAKVGGANLSETEFASELRELQKQAQSAKKGRWVSYEAPASSAGGAINGKVSEVVSGDSLIIRDDNGEEKRVYLSSTKAPKQGRKGGEPGEAYSYEAKEFLRKKFIGKKVKATIDYTREPMGPGGTAPPPALAALGTMNFATVIERGTVNVAVELIAKGFATYQRHRADDDVSEFMDDLVAAEKKAEEAKIGIHSTGAAPAHRFNDLVGTENSNKAKQMGPSIVRMGKIDGVIDFVFNAGRFKVRVDRENLYIPFVLAGIKVPQTARLTGPGPKKAADPFADEAYAFARELILQQDVQVETHTYDRGGNCLGTLWYKVDGKNKNMAETLCEMGLAKTVEYSLQGVPAAAALLAAEEVAKKAELRLWTLPQETAGEETVLSKTYSSVEVVHIDSIDSFYIQESPDPSLERIMGAVATAGGSAQKLDPGSLKKGMLVLAQWSGDWYRGQVTSITAVECEVRFVDFGNSEKKAKGDCKPCPATLSLQSEPARAVHVGLGGLQTTNEHMWDAAGCFGYNAKGKFRAQVEYAVNGIGQCVLTSVNGGMSVNEKIAAEGLARADPKTSSKISVFAKIQGEATKARRERKCMWAHGDNFDDDEDEYTYSGRF